MNSKILLLMAILLFSALDVVAQSDGVAVTGIKLESSGNEKTIFSTADNAVTLSVSIKGMPSGNGTLTATIINDATKASNTIGTQSFNVTAEAEATPTFNLDFTSFEPGNYTIRAEASRVDLGTNGLEYYGNNTLEKSIVIAKKEEPISVPDNSFFGIPLILAGLFFLISRKK